MLLNNTAADHLITSQNNCSKATYTVDFPGTADQTPSRSAGTGCTA